MTNKFFVDIKGNFISFSHISCFRMVRESSNLGHSHLYIEAVTPEEDYLVVWSKEVPDKDRFDTEAAFRHCVRFIIESQETYVDSRTISAMHLDFVHKRWEDRRENDAK